ncbi:MAG: MoxR family ATPase [Candidatus Thermoplasmatota archaeon]|jgi:MoxR-like ATPase|nr:MoxR family ATPase [Candidatus Thermoplasmatota archaeon]MCL5790376.1 MoxR family ATPase [Candidatus Thermoplasmatota archaeon]
MNSNFEENVKESLGKTTGIVNEISRYFVGDKENLSKMVSAIISSGHILLQDNPGIGKTFVAKLMSSVLGLSFRRVQFTPDLLPSDITGTRIWRASTGQFETMKGPIFANLILADEINRAPPKTQAALLESMEERQVTIEGETIPLPLPFLVIATQNPIEFEGTYPLPEAQMDRFMIQLSFGYPQDDLEILRRRKEWKTDDPSSKAAKILDQNSLLELQGISENITVDDEIMKYISSFRELRNDKRVMAGPSPRGIISLLRISRSYAMVNGRDYVIPDDVKSMAVNCLAHRLVLKPEQVMDEVRQEDVVSEFLEKLEVPK